MPLISDAEVRAIIETEIDDLSPFINLASLVVSEAIGTKLSQERRKEIERWLTAHFLTIRTELGGITSESIGSAASFSYQQVAETGFASTRYGQQAVTLDTTGKLRAASKQKARFQVI